MKDAFVVCNRLGRPAEVRAVQKRALCTQHGSSPCATNARQLKPPSCSNGGVSGNPYRNWMISKSPHSTAPSTMRSLIRIKKSLTIFMEKPARSRPRAYNSAATTAPRTNSDRGGQERCWPSKSARNLLVAFWIVAVGHSSQRRCHERNGPRNGHTDRGGSTYSPDARRPRLWADDCRRNPQQPQQAQLQTPPRPTRNPTPI